MRRAIALLSLVAAAGPGHAAVELFELLPEHSFVHFEVLHFGTSTIRGRLGPVAGTVELDRAAGRGRVGVAIEMDGVSTGWPFFDRRLREPDLLATEAHPQAWFVAERFVFEGPRLVELRGELTLRGTSAPLALRAERFACRAGPPEVCGGDFVGELDRSRFGADFGLPWVADRVQLRIQAEGRRR